MKTLLLTLAALITFSQSSYAVGLCDDPIRDQQLCYKMKLLRAEIDVLDAQRDLMQINYSLLHSTATDSIQIVDKISLSAAGQHLSALKDLKLELTNLLEDSSRGYPDALKYSNNIKDKCMTCHSNNKPKSGITWKELSANTWEHIYPHCNTTENPYRCKSMHGMKTTLQYYNAAAFAQHESFEQTGKLAQEVSRIASDLQEKGMIKGRHDLVFFKNVQKEGLEIQKLAEQKDPATFMRAQQLSQTCMQCHMR
ncbi:MAG: hypothetical protein IPM57_11195 [Oligoflexia bacterium]|nr:hypothetical protein [Oligoflexia bacterium]